ncbi:MAG TPA: MFS transporter [Stellaceae bacterium]|nr:MFS transporter [Stellaceae bacterium]
MRANRAAVSIAFLLFGVTAGTFLPRLSAVKDNLRLTDGQVGVVFLVFAIGAVISAGAGRAILARGSRTPVRAGLFVMCVMLAAQGLAPTFVSLAVAFLVVGLCVGAVDMLLNSQATAIERESGRPMINSFHGFWSLDSIAGSLIAVAAAAAAVSPAVHLTVVGVVLALASIPLVAAVPNTRGASASLLAPGSGRWHIGAAVAVVSALALASVTVEGAGGDWSAIYLRDFGHAPESVAALGFGVLSVAMTAVRFTADRLTALAGLRVVAALGGLVAGLGFLLAIAFPAPASSLAGWALVGAGTAVLFPLAMTSASNIDKRGTALTIATAAGYAGSIVAPPAIGAAADRFGLRLALLIPALGALAVVGMMASTRVLSSSTTRRLADATEGLESKA